MRSRAGGRPVRVTSFSVFKFILTFRPASLLCWFITPSIVCISSFESTKSRLNFSPKFMSCKESKNFVVKCSSSFQWTWRRVFSELSKQHNLAFFKVFGSRLCLWEFCKKFESYRFTLIFSAKRIFYKIKMETSRWATTIIFDHIRLWQLYLNMASLECGPRFLVSIFHSLAFFYSRVVGMKCYV